MANGRVTTGFSKPYVALYNATDGVVTYSNGQALARGVEVSVEVDEGGDNNFYADNLLAETDSSVFTSGTVTVTVDGLKDPANRLIFGLPEAVDGWTDYDADQKVPFVGLGFIVRVQEDQNVSYVPFILKKLVFNPASTSAATQEENIDWQTQELTARILRDDSAKACWKKLGEQQASEAAAEQMIKQVLGIGDEPTPDPDPDPDPENP